MPGVHRAVERVQHVGPVERDREDRSVARDLDLGHRANHNRTRVRPARTPTPPIPSLELDRPVPHVLRLTLRAPGKLNAVSGTMHGELAAVWRTIADDDETRAVIVRGADGAFSAGGDLDLVLEIANDPRRGTRVPRGARPRLQRDRLPETDRVGDDGPRDRSGLAVGLLADISIATRTRGSSTGTRSSASPPATTQRSLAAALRAREGEVPPAALRAGRRRRGRADRARLALRPRGRARRAGVRDRDAARRGSQPAIRHTKLALNNWCGSRGPPSTRRSRSSSST